MDKYWVFENYEEAARLLESKQDEIDELVDMLEKAEALLERIRTVQVLYAKTWFSDIDSYFKHKGE